MRYGLNKHTNSEMKTLNYLQTKIDPDVRSKYDIDYKSKSSCPLKSIRNADTRTKTNFTMVTGSSEGSFNDEIRPSYYSTAALTKYSTASKQIRMKLKQLQPMKIDPFLNNNKICIGERTAEKFVTPVDEYLLGEANKDKLRNIGSLEHKLYQGYFDY